jgi:hypothetical protein
VSPDDHITSNAEVAINYSTMFDRPTSPSPQPLNRLAVPPSLTLREASLSPPPDQAANTPQQELISFESFSTPTASPGPQDNAAAGPSTQPQMATTINYLSPSPRRAISPIRIQCDIIDTGPGSPSPMRRSPRLSPAEELPTVDGQVPSPYERPTRPEPRTPISLSPSPALKDQLEAPQPQTPRRSPRRSVTPQSLKPEPAGSPPPIPPLPAGIATSSFQTQFETPLAIGAARSLVEPPSGAQTRKKRWKGKEKATSPGAEVMNDSQEERSRSGSVDSENKVDQLEEKEERKGKRRQEQAKEKEERMHRELGSLSPGSANVLAQLYPSIQATMTPNGSPVKEQEPKGTDTTEVAPQESNPSIFPPHLSALLASVQRPPPGSPVRLASPSGGRPSPTKLIPNLDLEDPTRTPARRIPIRQAIAQGTASAQMLAHKKSYLRPNDNGGLEASLRSPVFSRALDDPLRSPAKRIPISEVFSSAKNMDSSTPYGLQTPVRGISRERSGSAEPRPRNGRERSGSAEPQTRQPMDLPRSSTSFRPASKLPFPLVAAQPPEHDRPTSIPEESEGMLSPRAPTPPECDTTVLPPASSPAKSGLKQPSSSRIPRIGSKPYTRPTTSVKDQESKLLTGGRRVIADSKVVAGTVRLFSRAHSKSHLIYFFRQTKLTNSVRLVKSGSASGSSSDDINIAPGSSARAKAFKDTPASTNLKRKRGEKTSPSQTRPIVLIRQVIPGMLGPKYAPSTPPAAPPSTKDLGSTQVEISPVKKAQRPITMRRVVDRLPEKNAARDRVEQEADAPDIVDEEMGDTAGKHDRDEHAAIMVAKKSSQVTKKEAALLSSSPILPEEAPVPSQDTADNTVPEHHTSGSSPLEDDTEFSTKVRRTTRARKQTPLNDVFTAPRPLQPRRKTPTSNRSDSDGFSGLSSVALKALTSSNTARNQLNFVSLATEVIRKDGCRPESPIMKVRTISQREAEEKSKGRSERAHRRARRSDEGLSDTDGFSSDRGDSSIVEEDGQWDDDDEDEEVRPYKHRRGPGDDEDYETPAKPERTLKRPRLGEEKEESQEEIQEKKRVKWDRGLYSEIYLDEIEIKPKKRPKEDIVKKGCLAPTAKVYL